MGEWGGGEGGRQMSQLGLWTYGKGKIMDIEKYTRRRLRRNDYVKMKFCVLNKQSLKSGTTVVQFSVENI